MAVACCMLAACTGGGGSQDRAGSPDDNTLQAPLDEIAQPIVAGVLDLGPPLVGATVHLRGPDGIDLVATSLSGQAGEFGFVIDALPAGSRVEATGGSLAGAPFEGTIAAMVDDDTPDDRSTWVDVNLATTLVVEKLERLPSGSIDEAEAAVREHLDVPIEFDLGQDTSATDRVIDQAQFVAASNDTGGFDALIDATADAIGSQEPQPLRGSGDLGITPDDVARGVGQIVVSKATDIALTKLGLNEQANALRDITQRLNALQVQVTRVNDNIQNLANEIKVQRYTDSLRMFTPYVSEISETNNRLVSTTIADLALQDAKASGDQQRITIAETTLTAQKGALRESCSANRTRFRTFIDMVANDLHRANGGKSFLDLFVENVFVPRRYLTTQDSNDLSLAFYYLYAAQQRAGRLHVECSVALGETAEVAMSFVYDSALGILHTAGDRRHDVFKEPMILPSPVPTDTMLDVARMRLWANVPTQPRIHPRSYIDASWYSPAQRMPETIQLGAYWFSFPYAKDLRDLVLDLTGQDPNRSMLGQPKSPAWKTRSAGAGAGDVWPGTWRGFFMQIGLDRAASLAPDAGELGFYSVKDLGGDNRLYFGPGDEFVLRRYGGLSSYNGTMRWYPHYYDRNRCGDENATCTIPFVGRSRAEAADWINAYRATTIYFTNLDPSARFTTLDLSPIKG